MASVASNPSGERSPEGRTGRTSPYPPDFLILGAQKCGTTSLAAALRSHPQVFVPRGKEADHFGRVPDDEVGGAHYQGFFGDWAGEQVVGEATPTYLLEPRSAEQICRFLPEVRAIAILRNPTDRAYSAYWHKRRRGLAQGSFADLIEEHLAHDGSDNLWSSELVGRGRYAEQLQRYFDLGFDRERMLILLFEEMVTDDVDTLRTVQEFIGVDPIVTELPRLNETARSLLPRRVRRVLDPHWRTTPVRVIERLAHRPFDPPPMDPAVRARLVEYFRPHNARLAELLGRDLAEWDR